MAREALRDRFIAALLRLGGSAGNRRLQDELGWQDDTYDRVRDALVEDGAVVRGRGQGGSVSLADRHPRTAPARANAPSREAVPEVEATPPKARAKAAVQNGGGFEQTFKAIDNVLRNEAGQTTELDYTEQTSWMLFLKYLDDLEIERKTHAELEGNPYQPIIDDEHRWGAWAAPRKKDGSFDHDRALTGDDLIAYVNDKLWPYLQGFKRRATGPDTIEYKIGEVFGEIKPKFQSGYSLRDALELVDGLRFRSQTEKHELSHLYEAKIRNMGNAGRNGGEYYTPRPLIRAMIQVVKPRIGERIYDGACGSAGFLCEAYEYLLPQAQSTTDRETLQRRTFHGKEKKSLAYVIAIMNMILHGIEAPNVLHANTLAENVMDLQEKDRFDVVLANPPFGGGGAGGGAAELPDPLGRDGLSVPAALHALAARGRTRRDRHQEHLSFEHGRRLHRAAAGIAGELRPAHDPGHAAGHVPGRGREDGGAVLREGAEDAADLVLQARSGPQPGQDQCAERRRYGGVRPVAGRVRGGAEKLDGGGGRHRPGDLGFVGQEPEWGRCGGASGRRRRSWPRSRRWTRKARACWSG